MSGTDAAGPDHVLRRLRADADVFRNLLTGVSEEQARWKPSPGEWSLLEVVNHLADEERDDFRARIRATLDDPGRPWPAIDPEAWATERRYNERELAASLDDFLTERARSVAWLEEHEDIDLAAGHEHPRLGHITVADLLGSWLAHDLIHVRQMTRLHRQYLESVVALGSLGYAGRW